MISQSPVMTAKEVADLLRVNIKTVYEAAKKKRHSLSPNGPQSAFLPPRRHGMVTGARSRHAGKDKP